MSDTATTRQLTALRTKLNRANRSLVCTDTVYKTVEKKYHYLTQDIKLLRFAESSAGSISDCYILYAIARLGCCNLNSIILFIETLKRQGKEPYVPSPDQVKNRLREILKNGMIFKFLYSYDALNMTNGEACEDNASLFTVDRDSYVFMNQKLLKNVKVNTWIQAKPIHELIAHASAAYIGTVISQNSAFVEFCDGTFKAGSNGQIFIPCEMKMQSDNTYYVACMPGYLTFDSTIMTESDFEDYCIMRVNNIRNYFQYREKYNKQASVVIAIENSDNLDKFVNLIENTEILFPYLEHIYFSGEGLIDTNTDSISFLQLKRTSNGYTLVPAMPEFMS